MTDESGLDFWHIASAVVGALLSAAFGLWAWVVKVFGQRHLEKMDDIIERLDKQGERIANLEGKLNK